MKHPLVSHLAHVELRTPNLEGSLWFFRDLLGMEVVESHGQSTYLRGWGDLYHHSLKLTESMVAGLGHMSWRALDAEALQVMVATIEPTGRGKGWIEGDRGHGSAYSFTTPDGHECEILWDVDWYEAPPELVSPMPSRQQRYVGRGAAVRRIDHVTLLASDVRECREYMQEHLGFRFREASVSDDGEQELGAWLAATNLSHDTAYVLDGEQARGRLHHVAYWQDTREEVLRAADILKDAGLELELGPTRHALSEAFFLYVREPGGNRVEIYSGAALRFAPDWGPIKWRSSQRSTLYWPNGEVVPASLFTGTPAIDDTPVANATAGPTAPTNKPTES